MVQVQYVFGEAPINYFIGKLFSGRHKVRIMEIELALSI